MRWDAEYKKCCEVIERFEDFIRQFESLTSHGEDVRRWLLRWIDAHPLHHFCSLRDWVCGLTTAELTDQTHLTQVLFWLLQDCRNAFLTCDCHACLASLGVPLARVWLYIAADPTDKRHCTIISIDPYPPYRRPLRTECWPAPPGTVNVGQVIWHRWQDACTTLADLGVRVRNRVLLPLTNIDDLKGTCQPESLFVPCGRYVDVWTYDAGALGQRVVGFRLAEISESLSAQPGDVGASDARADDLTRIEGIGPRRADMLREAGITTFGALAECPIGRLLELSLNANEETLRRWQDEARRLAAEEI
jgi:hypothetical protein